jgi:hypothetical protein
MSGIKSRSTIDMQMHFKLLCVVVAFCVTAGLECGCKDSATSPSSNTVIVDSTSHVFAWRIDTVGLAQSILFDAWGTGPKNVYAVGSVYYSSYSIPAINIIHWDGGNWSPVNYSQGTLRSIFGLSESDIWAVGEYDVGVNSYSLIAHWNGVNWETLRDPNYPGLFAVWGRSSTDVYAVGDKGTVLHFDGTAWRSMASPTQLSLRRIWGNSSGDLYAVGGELDTDTGVLLKIEGSSWKKMFQRTYSPDVLSGINSGLWTASPSKIYVGTYVGHDTIWAPSSVPNDNVYIEQIKGDADINLFAVGSFGLMTHFNGHSWHRYPEFYMKPGGPKFYGVWTGMQTVFVVGYTNDGLAIVIRGNQ